MSSEDFKKDKTLSALVNLLDEFMNVGLSETARQKYLCKWCLYTGNPYFRVQSHTKYHYNDKSFVPNKNVTSTTILIIKRRIKTTLKT